MWGRLSNLSLKITDGTHHSPPNYQSGEYKYVSAKNITDNGLSLNEITYVSKIVFDEIYSRCDPVRGDILYVKDGATTGRCCINELDEKFALLSSVALIRPSSYVSTQYILLSLHSPEIYQSIREQMSGCAITRVTLKKMESFLIPVPPVKEQLRIINRMKELEIKINEYAAFNIQIDKIDSNVIVSLRNALLQYAIQGKLVPQDPNNQPIQIKCKNPIIRRDNSYYEIIDNKEICIDGEVTFDVPSGWMICRQGDVLEFINGKSYDINEVVPDGKYKLIRVGNLFTSDQWLYTNTEHEEKQYCENGDLLFGWSMSIGPYIWDGGKSVYVQHIWKIIHQPYFDTKYLYYLLLAEVNELKSIKHGSSMQHITLKMMKHRICCIPPMNEQKRIVEKIELLQSSLGHLDDLH